MAQLIRRLMIGLLLVGALAACDPPPPPPVIEVNAAVPEADANPGDGVCETAPGNGVCPLLAAIQEGDAMGQAVIRVPSGLDVQGHLLPEHLAIDESISGDLTIVADGSQDGLHGWFASLTVETGATLRLEQVQLVAAVLEVDGSLTVDRSTLAADIVVGPGGVGLVVNSFLFPGGNSTGPNPQLRNAGRFHIRYSAVVKDAPVIETLAGGETNLGASEVFAGQGACIGDPVVSEGYNVQGSDAGAPCFSGSTDNLEEWADQIPLGVLGCGTDVAIDIGGRVRPTDGDGDGVAACDIGPTEH